MDHMGSPPLHPADHRSTSQKRKRSLSNEPPAQATHSKHPKTNSQHLSINYLVRQRNEDLPLISPDHDPLPTLLSLIHDYDGVLQRHESMAGNLGARPLGPILIQRFERLFDGPPRVLKQNGRESNSVGWLDVVEFARSKPEQFKLEQTRDGVKVCQFYTKQCRVEISEEDFVLVRSGIPNKMIPPQPIGEDEEKELGTLEILEKALGNSVHLADQVAGRARQLNHKLKHRKNAIIARREAEVAAEERARSPAPVPRTIEYGHSRHQSNGECASPSPTHRGGFVAVNKHPASNDRSTQNGNGNTHEHTRTSSTLTNGTSSLHSASAATRAELLSKFHTKSERSGSVAEGDHLYKTNPVSRPSAPPSKPNSKPYADSMEYAGVLLNTASPVPIPNTPSSLLPYVKPSPADRFDDSGPYKSDMMARMEQLNRGDRVQPPCDRCRRLHMDCLKNLTACMGCTKKHAKCSWKDVEEQELKDHPFIPRIRTASEMADLDRSEGEGSRSGGEAARRGSRPILQEVRDEELLGEESADDELDAAIQKETAPQHSVPPPSISPGTTTMEGHRPHLSDDLPSMTHSSGTNSTFDIIRDTNPSEPSLTRTDSAPRTPTAPFQAPQAQMQRFPSYDHSSSNNGSNGINGHAQTEYEKDIYSQLNEATRSSAELEKAITSAQVASTTAMSNVLSHEEPMRVYTAGAVSESYQSEASPAHAPISAPQGEPMDVDIPRGPSPTTTYTQEIEKPQMPSPPLSSVPKQTASLLGTPGVEQVFGGQSLQT